MIKGNYDARNYIYVLSTIDEFEHIIEIADTQQDMADLLGIDLSAVNKFLNRHVKNENVVFIKNRKLERVKIYDYVYIVYEKNISSPLYVSRDLKNIATMSGFSRLSLTNTLHNRLEYERKRKRAKPQVHKLQGKYFVKQVDLLDLDINLSKFLESCIDKGEIKTSLIEDFENMEEGNVKEKD